MKKNLFGSFVSILIALILMGCSDNNTEDDVGVFLVVDGIKIQNGTSSDIAFFAADREMLALLTWALICGDDNVISAGKNKVIEFSSILGYGPGKTIVVYYWECPRSDGEEIFNSIISTE